MKTVLAAMALAAFVPAAAVACDYYDPAKSAETSTPAPVAAAPAPATKAVTAKAVAATPTKQVAQPTSAPAAVQKVAANAVK